MSEVVQETTVEQTSDDKPEASVDKIENTPTDKNEKIIVKPAPIKKKLRGIGRSYLSPNPWAYIFTGDPIHKNDIPDMIKIVFLIIWD